MSTGSELQNWGQGCAGGLSLDLVLCLRVTWGQVACVHPWAALSHPYFSCKGLHCLEMLLSRPPPRLPQCTQRPGVVAGLAVFCDFRHASEQGLCFLCSGCEKTFITVSALFSHNRAHFREQELFSCSFPGCSKQYDKACRLKIHLRSHTGNEPGTSGPHLLSAQPTFVITWCDFFSFLRRKTFYL